MIVGIGALAVSVAAEHDDGACQLVARQRLPKAVQLRLSPRRHGHRIEIEVDIQIDLRALGGNLSQMIAITHGQRAGLAAHVPDEIQIAWASALAVLARSGYASSKS